MSTPVRVAPPVGEVVLSGPWRGSSLPVVRRISGIVWVLGVLFCAPMVLLLHPVPPDDPVAVTAAVLWAVVMTGGALWCLHPRGRAGFRTILALNWLELLAMAVLQHHADGWSSSYHQLIGIEAVVVAACFPSRAAVPYVVASLVVTLAPLATGDVDGQAGDVLLHTATWLGLCGVGLVAMRRLRAQRLVLADEARVDRLTRIGNRYACDADLGAALADPGVTGRRIAVGVGDVDDFKGVNDAHGHLVGDRCLVDVAAALAAAAGTTGTAYRWAGDEFVVVLVGEDDDDLRRRCTGLEAGATAAARTPDDVPLEMTFGWATAGEDGDDATELLAAADERLMRRKRARTPR